MRKSAVKRWFNPLYRTVLQGFCLPLASFFLFPWLTCSRTLPNTHAQHFPKMDSAAEGSGDIIVMGYTYYGVVSPPFLTPKEPPCACADGEVFLDLRSGHLISLLQQSSASTTSFVLGVSGWEQSFTFTPLDKYQLSSPGAHLFPTSVSEVGKNILPSLYLPTGTSEK